MSLTAVTVIADRTRADGTNPAGTLTFTLSAAITNGSETVTASPITVPLIDGVATATLYANDDTGTTPAGTSYTVTEFVDGATQRNYPVTVAHSGPNPFHI
jgi:hypothetical protein